MIGKDKIKICSISGLIFVLLSASILWAQDARFRGTVKDEQGNPIADAKITLTLIAQNLSFSFKSNKKGKFYRRGIEPGEYMLSVEVEEFQPLKQQIYIKVGEELKMDIMVAKEASIVEAKNQFVQGIKFYQQGKFDQAINAFEAILKEKPDFAECYYNLGMAYLRKGDVEAAITAMEKAIELKPDFIEAYFGLGQAYINKGEDEKAGNIFNKALEINPDNAAIQAMVYVNLGTLYFSNNKDDLAMEALNKAKELDPSLPNTYYQFGLLHFKKGELEKSIENFEKFLELAPQSSEAESVKAIIEDLKKRIAKPQNEDGVRSSFFTH